jgi:pimeloyl-ACP methyl ester carboxylesterase
MISPFRSLGNLHRTPALGWLGLTLLFAAIAGARAQEPIAAPGIVFQVADTRLHVVCSGSGHPLVVLEAGLGGNYLDWSLVRPLLAPRHRVCAYDRAGAGFSERTERPRNLDNMTEELHWLVAAAELDRPFLLVGHSFGGLLAMDYARRYPADVSGLVLVDSMHPDQFERFARAGVEVPTDPHMVLGRTPSAASVYGLPPDLHRLALQLAQADKNRVFIFREMRAIVENAHALRDAGYPSLPVRLLVHGNREWDQPFPDGRMEQAWRDMQNELATRLGAPQPVIVNESGHQIALDAPQAVAAAIDALSQ